MNTKRLRKMTKKELENELDEKRKDLSEKKFDIRAGSETDYAQIRELKKEVARIFTVLNSGDYKKETNKKNNSKK